jgi:hypothetical protein
MAESNYKDRRNNNMAIDGQKIGAGLADAGNKVGEFLSNAWKWVSTDGAKMLGDGWNTISKFTTETAVPAITNGFKTVIDFGGNVINGAKKQAEPIAQNLKENGEKLVASANTGITEQYSPQADLPKQKLPTGQQMGK